MNDFIARLESQLVDAAERERRGSSAARRRVRWVSGAALRGAAAAALLVVALAVPFAVLRSPPREPAADAVLPRLEGSYTKTIGRRERMPAQAEAGRSPSLVIADGRYSIVGGQYGSGGRLAEGDVLQGEIGERDGLLTFDNEDGCPGGGSRALYRVLQERTRVRFLKLRDGCATREALLEGTAWARDG